MNIQDVIRTHKIDIREFRHILRNNVGVMNMKRNLKVICITSKC